MKAVNQATIDKVYWKDVREATKAVNPEFAQAVDQLDPGENLPIYKATYPFGTSILKDGILQIPLADGSVAPITSSEVPNDIKNSFSYTNNMPIGVILSKAIELYCKNESQITPWIYMLPGRIFGLWAFMRPHHVSSHGSGGMWQITAGARFLFFLSKISNSGGFQRVKKEFGLKSKMPLGLLDQWPVLSELANSPDFSTVWQVELLFFSYQWKELIDNMNKNLSRTVVEYLQNYLLGDSEYLREQTLSDFVFSVAMSKSNLRSNPYLADTFRHIYLISAGGNHCGAKPAFRFSNSDKAGPIAQFQKIFDELYGMYFSPTMVNPGILTNQDSYKPIYYSLEVPTVWSYLPRSKKARNKLNDLREIKHIQQVIKSYLLEDKLCLKDTPLYRNMIQTSFEYFHSDQDKMGEITSSTVLEQIDEEVQSIQKIYKKPFCYSSQFLRGCVRINPKK